MKKKGLSFVTLLLLSLFVLLSPSAGSCSPTYQVTEEQMLQLQNILDGLESDNNRLLLLLNESTEGLAIAESESGELKIQLNEAQSQLKELRTQLATLKSALTSARTSLDEANKELKLASESYKKSMQQHERVESRLRTQRNVWEVLCAVAVGFAVSR